MPSKSNRAFRLLFSKAYDYRGASMGRDDAHETENDIGPYYDRKVPLDSGGYDPGGAYWGIGRPELRVTFNADLTYVRWYRAMNY